MAEGGLGESERGKEVEEEEGSERRDISFPAMTMPSAEDPWVEDTSHPNPNTVIGATRRQVPPFPRTMTC